MGVTDSLNVTLVQTQLFWEDAQKNLTFFDQLLGSEFKTSDLIILPEMFTSGFTMNAKKCAQTMEGEGVQFLIEKAKTLQVHLVGSLIIKEDEKYFNRMCLAGPDGKIKTYDKKHLFRMAKEEETYTAGKSRLIFEVNDWKIAGYICYDLRFPVWCRNVEDAEFMFFIANWPERRSAHWKLLLQARAIENQCYVVGVNRVGTDGNDVYYSGDSTVFDPKGEILFQAAHHELTHTLKLDKSLFSHYRNSFPAFRDSDHFQIL